MKCILGLLGTLLRHQNSSKIMMPVSRFVQTSYCLHCYPLRLYFHSQRQLELRLVVFLFNLWTLSFLAGAYEGKSLGEETLFLLGPLGSELSIPALLKRPNIISRSTIYVKIWESRDYLRRVTQLGWRLALPFPSSQSEGMLWSDTGEGTTGLVGG